MNSRGGLDPANRGVSWAFARKRASPKQRYLVPAALDDPRNNNQVPKEMQDF